jgi:hypothetical protein
MRQDYLLASQESFLLILVVARGIRLAQIKHWRGKLYGVDSIHIVFYPALLCI